MTAPVVAVGPSTSVADAARLMLDGHISGLPVVDSQKRLVGVVTEGDFLRRGELGTGRERPRWLQFLLGGGASADDYVHANSRRIDEVMSGNPVTIAPEATLQDLVRLMTTRQIKRVPVVAAAELVGIVSRSDVVRALVQAASRPDNSGRTVNDTAIQAAVHAELAKGSWGAGIRCQVTDGIVTLKGAVMEMRAMDAARVAAENVEGVTEVIVKLIWVDGMSGTCIFPEDLGRDTEPS
jgi:CBS domain-containing protein